MVMHQQHLQMRFCSSDSFIKHRYYYENVLVVILYVIIQLVILNPVTGGKLDLVSRLYQS